MMLSVLLLIFAQPTSDAQKRCDDPQTDRDVKLCKYLKEIEKLEIKTVDKVAVGTHDEMLLIRPAARACKLINQIDYVSENTSVFRVINASKSQKKCIIDWVSNNLPNNIFSQLALENRVTIEVIKKKPCDDPQTQHQMNACAYEEYQAADNQLNAQWKVTYDYMKSLDKDREDDGRIGHAEALLKAQKSWIAFRDNHCLSESYRFRGGSAEPLLRYGCLAAETKRRTKALEELSLEG